MDNQDWNHPASAEPHKDETRVDIGSINGTNQPYMDKDDDIDIVLEASKNPSTAKLPKCIFRVPQLLRRHSEAAYEPDVVSIGPYHPRTSERFQTTENLKKRYLLDLCSHMNTTPQVFTDDVMNYYSSQEKFKGMAEFEKQARHFYADQLALLNREKFIGMMILDGCFLVQLFRKYVHKKQRDINDPIFDMDCMFQYLCHDLLLLENQIPWFVLQCVYDLTSEFYQPPDSSLPILILKVLSSQRQLSHNCRSYLKHLRGHEDATDNNLVNILSDMVVQDKETKKKADKCILHILDLIRTSIVFSFQEGAFERPYFDAHTLLIPSATALFEAGIQFKMSTEEFGSIMDIEYEDGVITIPHLAIGELTESIFRNLIAFEQCCYGRSHKITSYAVLMDNIIGSSKDMKFLCDKKIMSNWLSAESGSQFFNKLYNDTVLNYFYYGGLCKKINKEQTVLRRWKALFKRDYCSDLWKATSWVAAVILLVLTVMQTTYTLMQYYAPI